MRRAAGRSSTGERVKDVDGRARRPRLLLVLIKLYLEPRLVNQPRARNPCFRQSQAVVRILAVAATLRKEVVDCSSPTASNQREATSDTRHEFAVVALRSMVVVA